MNRRWLAGELSALSVRLERASEWAARTADRVWPPNSGIRAEQLEEFARGDRAPYVYGAGWRPNFMAAVEDQLRRIGWPRFAEGGEVQPPRLNPDSIPVVLGSGEFSEDGGRTWRPLPRPRHTIEPERVISPGETAAFAAFICPNTPPCPHPALRHDIEDHDDPRPRCCVDGCPCGSE